MTVHGHGISGLYFDYRPVAGHCAGCPQQDTDLWEVTRYQRKNLDGEVTQTTLRYACHECGAVGFETFDGTWSSFENTHATEAGYGSKPDRVLGLWLWPGPRIWNGDDRGPTAYYVKRVHPESYPVILPNRLLRRASDDDLAAHYQKVSRGDSAADERARAQILHEMDRRDQREARRRTAADRRQQRMFSRRMERQELIELYWLEAEVATKGNMLNRAGQEADIGDRSLFTGSEARARRYASEELLNHWLDHPRPTTAMLRGEDTRVYGRYTEDRRRDALGRRRTAR